jgi:hypothetical protein
MTPWMIYTCFYIFATVVSYVINTVAYFDTGDNLLACFSILRAVLTVCKYASPFHLISDIIKYINHVTLLQT